MVEGAGFFAAPPLAASLPMRTADLGKARIHYETVGRGPHVLLIPGFATNFHLFDGQVDALSAKHTVTRYDLRGQGKSSAPAAGYSTQEHVGDLAGLMGHLGVTRAHLVGASMGGAVAVRAALEHPDLVASLALAGAVVDGFSAWSDDFVQRLRRARKLAQSEGVAPALVDWKQHPFFGATRDREAFFARVLEYSGAGWLDNTKPARAGPSDFDRLPQIKAPTLAVVGSRDVEACKVIAREVGQRVPGARFAEVAGAGHLVPWDAPDEFNRALLGFLAGAEKRP